MKERKYFICRSFGHITCYCRNVREKRLAQVLLNKFEILKDRVMQKGKKGEGEVRKDRKEILNEKKAKSEVEVR